MVCGETNPHGGRPRDPQSGDTEGTALFDPDNERQARLVWKQSGPANADVLTLEQRRGIADRLGINACPIKEGLLASWSDDPDQYDHRAA
jgi:hypothetical protein